MDHIQTLFDKKCSGKDKIEFKPEIKVRRLRDIIYIYELRRTKTGLLAVVEAGTTGDKAPMPLGLLDQLSLRAIQLRLMGTGEKLVQIEKIK